MFYVLPNHQNNACECWCVRQAKKQELSSVGKHLNKESSYRKFYNYVRSRVSQELKRVDTGESEQIII